MERRVSHLIINRLGKEGVVNLPPILLENPRLFDQDLTVERGRQ